MQTPHVVIITDHKWHFLKDRYEVPDGVLKNQFKHLDPDEHTGGYFKYNEWWYHLSDFSVIDKHSPLSRDSWHGYHSDSFYSGVLVQLSQTCEQYRVGRYMA